ncbi:YceI family protein [Spirosoma luteum]|uniref:YceI family protein n=1 Tax=Spirosoma luteum TaxID=431553 RepID=UPI000476B0D1|nr:YceI family protein [Spirosoma luteum]
MLRFFLVCMLGLGCIRPAEQKTHQMPRGVTFQIRNAGITVNGSFSDLQTDIHFDPARLTESLLSASVGAATIRTGISLRDAHLQKRGYFDTDHHPRIRMVSKRIQKLSGNQFVGLFDLTIRDISREVELPFTYSLTGDIGHFRGQFKFNRQDFGIGTTSLVLADDVSVLLDVETPLKPL